MAVQTSTTTTTTTTTSFSASNNRRTGQAAMQPAATTSQSEASQGQAHHHSHHTDGTIQTLHDAPKQNDLHHGYGEDEEQHARHAAYDHVEHWGLDEKGEKALFYSWATASWCLNIVSGILGSYFNTRHVSFIVTAALFQFCSWAAWWQTATQMAQRASWVRDEANLPDRRRYLYLAVRLNSLMWPTAVISFCIFIVGYVRRHSIHDVPLWLLFLLIFIFNTVGCVMNAYNNITWESDRLEYEEGSTDYSNTLLAILGFPSKPQKSAEYDE